MGSDFEDSQNDEPEEVKEDSWENSSDEDEDDEYGSEIE